MERTSLYGYIPWDRHLGTDIYVRTSEYRHLERTSPYGHLRTDISVWTSRDGLPWSAAMKLHRVPSLSIDYTVHHTSHHRRFHCPYISLSIYFSVHLSLPYPTVDFTVHTFHCPYLSHFTMSSDSNLSQSFGRLGERESRQSLRKWSIFVAGLSIRASRSRRQGMNYRAVPNMGSNVSCRPLGRYVSIATRRTIRCRSLKAFYVVQE